VKSYWILIVTLVLLGALLLIKKSDFSFTDHIVDRVIERIDANYNPYGPNAVPPGQAPPQPQIQPGPSAPNQVQPNRPWTRPN